MMENDEKERRKKIDYVMNISESNVSASFINSSSLVNFCCKSSISSCTSISIGSFVGLLENFSAEEISYPINPLNYFGS